MIAYSKVSNLSKKPFVIFTLFRLCICFFFIIPCIYIYGFVKMITFFYEQVVEQVLRYPDERHGGRASGNETLSLRAYGLTTELKQ